MRKTYNEAGINDEQSSMISVISITALSERRQSRRSSLVLLANDVLPKDVQLTHRPAQLETALESINDDILNDPINSAIDFVVLQNDNVNSDSETPDLPNVIVIFEELPRETTHSNASVYCESDVRSTKLCDQRLDVKFLNYAQLQRNTMDSIDMMSVSELPDDAFVLGNALNILQKFRTTYSTTFADECNEISYDRYYAPVMKSNRTTTGFSSEFLEFASIDLNIYDHREESISDERFPLFDHHKFTNASDEDKEKSKSSDSYHFKLRYKYPEEGENEVEEQYISQKDIKLSVIPSNKSIIKENNDTDINYKTFKLLEMSLENLGLVVNPVVTDLKMAKIEQPSKDLQQVPIRHHKKEIQEIGKTVVNKEQTLPSLANNDTKKKKKKKKKKQKKKNDMLTQDSCRKNCEIKISVHKLDYIVKLPQQIHIESNPTYIIDENLSQTRKNKIYNSRTKVATKSNHLNEKCQSRNCLLNDWNILPLKNLKKPVKKGNLREKIVFSETLYCQKWSVIKWALTTQYKSRF